MRAVLQQAALDILTFAGEDVVLRGEVVTPARKGHIQQDVELIDRESNVSVAQFVLKTLTTYNPKVGDTLVDSSGKQFVLDERLDNNGYIVRFVLAEA